MVIRNVNSTFLVSKGSNSMLKISSLLLVIEDRSNTFQNEDTKLEDGLRFLMHQSFRTQGAHLLADEKRLNMYSNVKIFQRDLSISIFSEICSRHHFWNQTGMYFWNLSDWVRNFVVWITLMGKDFQNCELPTLLQFVRIRAAH